MTGPTRNRRRRGRRGQRPQPDENQVQEQNAQATPEREAPAADARPPDSRPSGEARRSGRRPEGGQQSERQGAGARKRNRGKRRSNRRPAIGPMPSEVLKQPFRGAPPTRQLERLKLDEVFAADEMKFGCPMLTRTRLALPSTGNQPSPRCSMGWALHSEQEVALCLRTPDMLDCWKLDAEREQRLRAEMEEDSAAD